ncbi:MAG: homogentisate 1,2-dioxygenase [Bdellovibrionales bacterium]|nr:homogentisate 1,2-dioxygenase [Bdellovibrionales bacterium]
MHLFFQGLFTKQAHKAIPDGCYEEEQGLKGFFGPVSHLIKRQPSTRWTKIDGPLRPHMFDPVKLSEKGGEGAQRLLYNANLNISLLWLQPKPEHRTRGFRNGDGDVLYFCHQGAGEVWSEYGMLKYRQGEYINIPKCLTHSLIPSEPSVFLAIENCTSHYEEPERGLVGRHALYDSAALGRPDLEAQNARVAETKAEVKEILVKRLDQITRFEYDAHYYDTLGWKGDLYPYTLHTDNIMPLMSHRAHLPPSAHTTFVARDFVVCTFLPRPLETDKDALKVPFYHQNIDYDEVLFYHAGDFFSRDNLHAGMMSLHPMGFPHGPHPKAMKSVANKTETNEVAVMIDSRWPLNIDPALESVELKDYWKSWRG